MKKYRVEIEVDDDFELGCCYWCPLNVTETYDVDGCMECDDYCVLMDESECCPLKECND